MPERRWKVRKFVDDDFEKASRLRKLVSESNGSSDRRSCEPEYYRWKLQDNPIRTGIFYVAHDSRRLVGMNTIIPKRLSIKGKLKNCAELCDGFTHPSCYRQGVFSALLNATREKALEQKIEFIYGTPNKIALPVEKKAGYDVIPSAKVYNLVRPINMAHVVENRLNSFILSKLFGPLVSIGFSLYYHVPSQNLEERGVKIYLVSEFPEDIYKLWEKVYRNYDWILERSEQYLSWRFVQNPDTYSIMLARSSRETIGYIVTKIGYWQNLKVGYLADFLIDEQRPEIFTELVLRSLKDFQQAKVDMVAGWAVNKGIYYNVLRRFGFRRHKKIPIICYKTDLCTKIINGAGKWHFTMADSDNI